MVIDPDPKPGPTPVKIPLSEPRFLFTVAETREDEMHLALGWRHVGPCRRLRATCCGSRAELRYPDGSFKVVRIGGVSSWGAIITGPQPLGDVPAGTGVWLLEVEASDLAK